MNSADDSTERSTARRISVYVDTDVLLAASASTTGASHLVIKLSEFTLIDGVITEAVRVEAERNLMGKLPHAVPAYRAFLKSARLREVALPSKAELDSRAGQADRKDLPHLVAAYLAGCDFLLTHNTRHYAPPPGCLEVVTPGAFLRRIREELSRLGQNSGITPDVERGCSGG